MNHLLALTTLFLLGSTTLQAEEYVRDGPEVLVQDSSVSQWWPEPKGKKLEVFIEDEILNNSGILLYKGLAAHDTGQPLISIHLASSGGSLIEAVKIASIFKSMAKSGRTVQTVVTEYSECMSACMIIFMAGTDRWVSTTARLGFHRARDSRKQLGNESETLRKVNDLLYEMMISSGVSKSVAENMRNTPSDKMYIVDGYDAIEQGIATQEMPTE